MVSTGLALIGFALPLPHIVEPVVACIAVALLNVGVTLHEILWMTVIQERVPDDKLGRFTVSINWQVSVSGHLDLSSPEALPIRSVQRWCFLVPIII
jgi:hypothetical protein